MGKYIKFIVLLSILSICSSILFFFKANSNVVKISFPSINSILSNSHQGFTCETWKDFSYIDGAKYKSCLTWGRNDAFWTVEGIRHTIFKGLLNSSSLIIEVGGNNGRETSKFMELYNPFIISFEPLVQKSKNLIEKFKTNSKIEIQPYGLGSHTRTLSIESFDSENSGINVFQKLSATDSSKIQLLDIVQVIENIRKTKTQDGIIDMITIDCEGCEFEILPVLILNNMTQYFRIIQFATHMDFLTESACIYCQIEEALERTHLTKYRYTMLWEAWILKNKI